MTETKRWGGATVPGEHQLVILLDRSGSMAGQEEEVHSALRDLFEKQTSQGLDVEVSVYQFDNDFECLYERVPIGDVGPITLIPRGMTALWDACHKAMGSFETALATRGEDPKSVLFVVITDGMENCSQEATRESVTQRQKSHKHWDFLYLGAGVTTWDDAKAGGFRGGVLFKAGELGAAMRAVGSSYGTYASSGGEERAMGQIISAVTSQTDGLSFSSTPSDLTDDPERDDEHNSRGEDVL